MRQVTHFLSRSARGLDQWFALVKGQYVTDKVCGQVIKHGEEVGACYIPLMPDYSDIRRTWSARGVVLEVGTRLLLTLRADCWPRGSRTAEIYRLVAL